MKSSNIEFDNDKVFLVFKEAEGTGHFDMLTLRMIADNALECFAECTVSEKGGVRTVRADISCLIPYKEYITKDHSYKKTAQLLLSAADALSSMRRYMIDIGNVCSDTDEVYVDARSSTIAFIPQPDTHLQRDVEYQTFFRELLLAVIPYHKDDDEKYSFYDLLSFVIDDGFTPESLHTYFKEHDGQPIGVNEEQPVRVRERRHGEQPERHGERQDRREERPKEQLGEHTAEKRHGFSTLIPDEPDEVSKMGDTEWLSAAELRQMKAELSAVRDNVRNEAKKKTVLTAKKTASEPAGEKLGARRKSKRKSVLENTVPEDGLDNMPLSKDAPSTPMISVNSTSDRQPPDLHAPVHDRTPRLTDMATKQVHIVNRNIFTIGRDPKENNDLIVSKKEVSRKHAALINRDGHWYVVDNNSRNHTFVNGRIIPSGNNYPTPIVSGDSLRFGTEEYLFEIGESRLS